MLRKPLLALTAALAVAAPLAPAQAAVDPGTGTLYANAKLVVPITFPVIGPTTYSDNFLACRSGCSRMHMGQDLMGPKMSPLVAAFDGIVSTISKDGGSGNYVGITATSGPASGWTAMYLHVNNDTPGTDDGKGTAKYAFPAGIELGSRVLAGQLIAWRGDSGNAEGTGPHLHFELRAGAGWNGVVYNAYPSLQAAHRISAPRPSGPHPDGTLVQVPSGATYLLDDGTKRPISSWVMAANGYARSGLIRIPAAEAALYPTGSGVTPREGALLRDPSGRTWLVSGGTRVLAPLSELLTPTARVWPIGLADLVTLPESSSPLSELGVVLEGLTPHLLDGALVRQLGTGVVYRLEAGALRPFVDGAASAAGWRGTEVLVLPALPDLPFGEPIGFRDGTLVSAPGQLGVLSGGWFKRLRDVRQIKAYGYGGAPALHVPLSAVEGLPQSELTTDTDAYGGQRYR